MSVDRLSCSCGLARERWCIGEQFCVFALFLGDIERYGIEVKREVEESG